MILRPLLRKDSCCFDASVTESFHDPYLVGSSVPLGHEQVQTIIRSLAEPLQPFLSGSNNQTTGPSSIQAPQDRTYPLGGRALLTRINLQGVGPVVIKPYIRGGLVERIFRDRHFRLGPWGGIRAKSRARQEYDFLRMAMGTGVQVPEPVGYAVRGLSVYRCWLITREIPNARTLAELSLEDPGQAEALMDPVLAQVRLLVERGMVHVDLHPGNVLVDQEGRAVIIDFDKAFVTTEPRNQLVFLYKKRWHRAVVRHRLPGMLYEKFLKGLP
ncbi:MAG: lipopolysaccharide kinase InaA family protein [Pseudomonadota bacterium]